MFGIPAPIKPIQPLIIGMKKIGELQVYPQQTEASIKVIDNFKNNKKSVLLIAQPQQGKTSTVALIIDEFIKYCESQGKSYEIDYIINIADNDLLNQTDDRLVDAALSNKVNLLHLSQAELEPKNVDCRLIVDDECHIALKKDKPLDKFFAARGVKYGSKSHEWENQNTFILSVSATPYAAVIKENIENGVFSTVAIKVSPEYFGLSDLKLKNRYHQSQKIIGRDKKPTDFFVKQAEVFIDNCESSNGYLIVRAVGENPTLLRSWLAEKYGDQIDVRIYSSKKGKGHFPISSLNDRLGKIPPKPFVVIILGSLRAGKTLSTTKHIKGWIEGARSNADNIAQVAGRCCGYLGQDKHSKFDDTFLIYCDKKEMEKAVSFYESDQYLIPSGVWNTNTWSEEEEYEITIYENEIEAKNADKAYGGLGHIKNLNEWKDEHDQQSLLSSIEKGKPFSRKVNLYSLRNDGKDNSYVKKFFETYPKLLNKIIGFKKVANKKITRNLDNKIKTTCCYS
jgi:hypothetical protein